MKTIKKAIWLYLLIILVLITAPVAVFASDISSAIYSGIITVTNNDTATTNVATIMTLNSQSLIDVYGVDTAFDYVAIRDTSGADVQFMPSVNSSYPWCLWVDSITSYASQNYILYTGNESMGATKYYFPGNGGMTVTDHATLEWGSQGNLSILGYFDTTQVGSNVSTHWDSTNGGINLHYPSSDNVQGDLHDYTNVNISLDGGDYCNKTASVVSPSGGEITVEAWAYRDAAGTFDTIIRVGSVASQYYALRFRDDNKIHFIVADSTGAAYAVDWASTNATVATTWYHITATYENGVGTKVYVNNYAWGGADGGGGGNIWQPNNNLYVGCTPALGDFHTGDVDEIRISNVARTEAEAKYYYNGGAGINYTVDANTISLWHFEKGAGTTVRDIAGNNTLTFGAGAAAPTWAATTPVTTLTTSSVYLSSITPDEYQILLLLSSPFFSLGIDSTDVVTSDNVVFNAPLWQPEFSCNTTSIDSNGHTCNVTGAITWAANTGYTFDGTNDIITVPMAASLVSGNGTWETWVKYTAAAADSRIMDMDSAGWQLGAATLRVDDGGSNKIKFSLDDGAAFHSILSDSALNDGVWHHVAVTFGATGMMMYVDGTLQADTDPYTGGTAVVTIDLGIGARATPTSYFTGSIGECRIYTIALTESQVEANRNATKLFYLGTGDVYTYSTMTSVPNSTADWIFFESDSVLYMETANVSVGGTPISAWAWEYDTTFHDSIGSNDATPTFRTASSDSDVWATLITFAPIDTAIPPPYTVSDAPLFYTENLTMSGNFTSANVSYPGGGPPGFGLIEDAATASNTPLQWIWGIIAMVVIVGGSFICDYMQKRYGFRSVWPKVFIGIVMIGLLVTFGKFDWWMLVMYGFIVIALAVASRHIDVGGAVSQHGLIGFLAMSWIGLTIINRIIEGQFVGAAEQQWANYYSFTQEFRIFNIFSVPVLNLEFFTNGIPALIRWDYSFFGGNAQLFQYLLYSITAVVSFVIFLAIIGLIYNVFRSIRG